MKMRGATMIMALAAAAAVSPLAVLADPPAVGAPGLPAPFIGAPMNDDSNNGQFSVNFDDQGRYLGIGTAAEHLSNFDLSPATAPARAQARAERKPAAHEESAVNSVFASFQEKLRVVSSEPAHPPFVGIARHR